MSAGTDTNLHTITSHVRGGGYGGSAWVAKITGPHPDYHLERRFVRSDREGLSRSGRSGQIRFPLTEPGYYEYRNVQHEAGEASIGDLDSGFLYVNDAGAVEKALYREDVIAALAAA